MNKYPDLPTCCTDMDIDLIDLIFPLRMSVEGKEFVWAHGIEKMTLEEIWENSQYMGLNKIKLFHRCQHLLDDGKCAIYDNRPKICRDFDCQTRSDCNCHGKGIINLDPSPKRKVAGKDRRKPAC